MVLGPLRHSHWVTSVAWEPDGQSLATGSLDYVVKIWNATTGHEDVNLRGHLGIVTSLAWGPDGRLASGGDYGSVEGLGRHPRSGGEHIAGTYRGSDVGVLEPGWQSAGVGLATTERSGSGTRRRTERF